MRSSCDPRAVCRFGGAGQVSVCFVPSWKAWSAGPRLAGQEMRSASHGVSKTRLGAPREVGRLFAYLEVVLVVANSRWPGRAVDLCLRTDFLWFARLGGY